MQFFAWKIGSFIPTLRLPRGSLTKKKYLNSELKGSLLKMRQSLTILELFLVIFLNNFVSFRMYEKSYQWVIDHLDWLQGSNYFFQWPIKELFHTEVELHIYFFAMSYRQILSKISHESHTLLNLSNFINCILLLHCYRNKWCQISKRTFFLFKEIKIIVKYLVIIHIQRIFDHVILL